MTPGQAMDQFLRSLELTPNQRDDAKRQHVYLRTQLQQQMSTKEVFLSGSFARKTAIRPLNDIDIVAVLDPAHHGGVDKRPLACLRELQGVLDRLYPNKEHPILQGRSVHIDFAGTGIGFDVVPAFLDDAESDVYLIADRARDRWLRTNPKRHAALSTEANERAGKKLKPLTKAVKRWRMDARCPARSFHLEVLAWGVLTSPPTSWVGGLATLFEGLADGVLHLCPDPAGLGPDLNEGLDRGVARAQLKEAARLARAAADAAAEKRDPAAHYYLRRLLGEDYPERGVAPGPR